MTITTKIVRPRFAGGRPSDEERALVIGGAHQGPRGAPSGHREEVRPARALRGDRQDRRHLREGHQRRPVRDEQGAGGARQDRRHRALDPRPGRNQGRRREPRARAVGQLPLLIATTAQAVQPDLSRSSAPSGRRGWSGAAGRAGAPRSGRRRRTRGSGSRRTGRRASPQPTSEPRGRPGSPGTARRTPRSAGSAAR